MYELRDKLVHKNTCNVININKHMYTEKDRKMIRWELRKTRKRERKSKKKAQKIGMEEKRTWT